MSENSPPSIWPSLCLTGGVLGIVAVLIPGVRAAGVWPGHPVLWFLIFATASGWGWWELWNARDAETSWHPTRRGVRFQSVVFYTRQDCPLCDEARDILDQYLAYLPPPTEVDIDQDLELRARFDTWVPVVEFDGVVRFKARIDEQLLRRLIEGTPPAM